MSIFRTIAMFLYLFGYMIVHYGTLRRAERALAAGDTETVEQLVDRHIPRLAKEELGKIPLLNRWMKLLGCVFVQRDDLRASVRALNDATAIVESGRSFVIFPEGTRYKGEEGGVGEFKNGAFRIAVKTGVPVVPVAITGARALFENNGNRCHPGRVHICILPPIRTAGMSKAEQKQLPEAVRQTILAKLK